MPAAEPSEFNQWVKPAFSGLSQQQAKLDQQTADFEAKLQLALAAVDKRSSSTRDVNINTKTPPPPPPLLTSTNSSRNLLPATPPKSHGSRGQSESDLVVPVPVRCAICSNGKRIDNLKVEALITQRRHEVEITRLNTLLQTIKIEHELEVEALKSKTPATKSDAEAQMAAAIRLKQEAETQLQEAKQLSAKAKKQLAQPPPPQLIITPTPSTPITATPSNPSTPVKPAPEPSPRALPLPFPLSRAESDLLTPRGSPRMAVEAVVLTPKELELNFHASYRKDFASSAHFHAFVVIYIQGVQDSSFTEVGRTEAVRTGNGGMDSWDDDVIVQRKRSASVSNDIISPPSDPSRVGVNWINKVSLTMDSWERTLKFEVYDNVMQSTDLSKCVFLGESYLKMSVLMGSPDKVKPVVIHRPGLPDERWEEALLYVKAIDLTPEQLDDPNKQIVRQKVAMEILTTERSYLEGIVKLETHFGNALKQVISKEDHDTIFGACTMLVGVNRALLKEIEARLASWNNASTMGDVFLTFAPYFRLYSSYVSGHEKTERLLNTLSKNKGFRAICEKGAQSSGGQLQSFLIMPIQRIPRYVLLLTELLKATSKLHADYGKLQQAIPLVQTVASSINKAISGAADELLAVQNSLNNCPDLLVPGRSLLRRGLLERLNIDKNESLFHTIRTDYRLKTYEFILMSDLIIFAKKLSEQPKNNRQTQDSSQSIISGMLEGHETRNIAGQIDIDNHFFVQEAELEGPTIFVERKNKGVLTKVEIRHVFRIFSMSGIYMWMAETEEDKHRWLELLTKAAGARQKEFEFKKLTGNILVDGLSMLVLSEDPEPQPSTLLFIPVTRTESHGWLQVRAWWEADAQMVHVMLIDARELRAADSNGFSDPYVKLKAYSIEEQHAIEHHMRHHDDTKRPNHSHAPRKLKPRWQAASKTVKKTLSPYWGESFSLPLTKADRTGRNRQLLRLEVWDSNMVLKETFLGQLTLDLTRIPEFTKMSTAPSVYTQMPDVKPEQKSDQKENDRSFLSRRGSESRSMRMLDFTKQLPEQDDSIFYSLLHAQSTIAGCKGRIYWLDRGAVLLQKNKSFTTGEIIEVRMGAPPEEHVEPEDDGQFAIVVHRGDKQHVLQLEAHSRGAAENWVDQVGQITPLIKIVDRPKELPKTQFLAPAVAVNRAQDIRLLLST